MFHLRNGLFFERLDGGSVRIVKTRDGDLPRPAVPDVLPLVACDRCGGRMTFLGEVPSAEDYIAGRVLGLFRCLEQPPDHGWHASEKKEVAYRRTGKPSNVEFELVVPENEWASVVATVSARGESYESWMAARAFHTAPC